jgi:pilus assembly protein CpaF
MNQQKNSSQKTLQGSAFKKLCLRVQVEFNREWQEDSSDLMKTLQLQKRAIIGYASETAYFKDKIQALVFRWQAEKTAFPPWYASLAEAIYHENWGLAGIAEWFSEPYLSSSSAKVIGDRIYFLDQGKMRLMPQTLTAERREQMIRAFLLLTPEERMDRDFHELYLLDGTRLTVFRGAMTKKGQDVIIFRRYIIPEYSFDEQAARGTIPAEAIPLFQEMVRAGFNIVVCGPVRSAKTTFLSTWQSYEDNSLEGVVVETDPEIPMHLLMPEAPIIQLLADHDRLAQISKNLLRSDADYFILAEARDGIALDTALRIAGKGTRRLKLTFHCRDALDLPYDVAWEIVRSIGGDLDLTAQKVARSFDFIFHFIQLKEKNRKRLAGIYELDFDRSQRAINVRPLCLYQPAADAWNWPDKISEEKLKIAAAEDPAAAEQIRCHWERLCLKETFA